MSESQPNWDAYLNIASLSDVGMRRSNNQDNLIVSLASSQEQWQKKGHLFIVADGMGAHAAGELAQQDCGRPHSSHLCPHQRYFAARGAEKICGGRQHRDQPPRPGQ